LITEWKRRPRSGVNLPGARDSAYAVLQYKKPCQDLDALYSTNTPCSSADRTQPSPKPQPRSRHPNPFPLPSRWHGHRILRWDLACLTERHRPQSYQAGPTVRLQTELQICTLQGHKAKRRMLCCRSICHDTSVSAKSVPGLVGLAAEISEGRFAALCAELRNLRAANFVILGAPVVLG